MAGHHQIWTLRSRQGPRRSIRRQRRGRLVDGPLKAAPFAQPSGLATDGKRLLRRRQRNQRHPLRAAVDGKGNVTTIVGEGLFEFGDMDGIGNKVRLQHALGVAYRRRQALRGRHLQQQDQADRPEASAPAKTYLGDPRLAEGSMFNEPGGLSIAGDKMYIADTNNHRIQIVDMKTQGSDRCNCRASTRRGRAAAKKK